jgi:small GTP-binding protein
MLKKSVLYYNWRIMGEKSYTFKIFVGGEAGVGKTSLCKRFVDGTFREDYKMSIGSDFFRKTVNFDDVEVRFQLWDLAGQDRFRFLLQDYVKGAVGVALVYDVTDAESLKKLDEWVRLNLCHNPKCGECVYAVLGNKIDLWNDAGAVTQEMYDDFVAKLQEDTGVSISWYANTSAKTGENVNEVFEGLAKIILKNA